MWEMSQIDSVGGRWISSVGEMFIYSREKILSSIDRILSLLKLYLLIFGDSTA